MTLAEVSVVPEVVRKLIRVSFSDSCSPSRACRRKMIVHSSWVVVVLSKMVALDFSDYAGKSRQFSESSGKNGLECIGCYCHKYRLSNLHIHHWLCRISPGYICRGILCIPQPTNHPTDVICTPCTNPEPIKGQDRQLDCIYTLLGCIYPLPLAHMIILNHFDRGPVGTLHKVIHYHSRDYTHFP